MFGDTSPLLLILAGAGLIVLAAGLWMGFRLWRKKRRQDRLERAFSRAKEVEKTGSSIQGTPYSLYGQSSWSDPSRDKE